MAGPGAHKRRHSDAVRQRMNASTGALHESSVAVEGTSATRLQGDRYVTGAIRYTDDAVARDSLHLVFVRSPHAHARILSIDKSSALAMAGVHAVLTGQDTELLIKELTCRTPASLSGTPAVLTLPCLTTAHVRYCGEPVALVVAGTREEAHRAAAAMNIAYEILPPLLGTQEAQEAGAKLQHPALPSNVAMRSAVQQGDAAAAIGRATHVVEGRIRMGRSSAIPLEPRSCIASWENDTKRLLVRAAIQQPHAFRATLAHLLELAESDIHVITPPLGGAFGFKFIGGPEEPLTCLIALRLRRSVRWVESRADSLLIGGREYDVSYRMGVDDTGKVLGLVVDLEANIGALTATPGPLMPLVAAATFPGPYRIHDFDVRWRAVMTNKGPWNGARGFGKEATCLVMETALDHVARQLGVSPVDIRRRNLLRREELPHRTPTMTIDSGDYHRALDMAMGLADHHRSSGHASSDARRRFGTGVAFELTPEGSDAGGTQSRGFETATVRIDTGGYATVLTGVTSPGTGSETAIAQLVASQLGIPTAHVRVVQGDTDLTPYGSGTFSSRAVMVGGTAAWLAARDLRGKLIQTASVLLKVPEEEIEVADGQFRPIADPGRGMTIRAIALALRTLGSALPGLGDPQLEVTRTYGPENLQSVPDASGRLQPYPTYSYSVHVAEVEVDVETGFTRVTNLAAVHDCGVVINRPLVEAQFHGAIAMGIGMALSEEERYDDAGRPTDDSFKKYLMPRIKDVPELRIGHLVTPSPFTALGTKGAGESGVGGACAAVVAAIRDAVGGSDPLPVHVPMTPPRVLDLIDRAAGRWA
jgi:carbon-monoxide dehydrogenase large subunit